VLANGNILSEIVDDDDDDDNDNDCIFRSLLILLGNNESQHAALRNYFVRMSIYIRRNGFNNGTLAIRNILVRIFIRLPQVSNYITSVQFMKKSKREKDLYLHTNNSIVYYLIRLSAKFSIITTPVIMQNLKSL
jgi:hypothetical protein